MEKVRTERKLRTPQNSPVEKNRLCQVVHRWDRKDLLQNVQRKVLLFQGGHGDLGKTKKKGKHGSQFWHNERAHDDDYLWGDRTFRRGWTGGSDLNTPLMKMRCRCDRHQGRAPTINQPPGRRTERCNQTKHQIVTILFRNLKHLNISV